MFTYLDANEDLHLLQFFKLKSSDIPKIIIYDFARGKYFIDSYSYLEDPNSMTKLNELIERISTDVDIKWTTGYLIEDVLSNLGINLSRSTMIILFMGVVTIFIITLIILSCVLIEKYEKKKKLD